MVDIVLHTRNFPYSKKSHNPYKQGLWLFTFTEKSKKNISKPIFCFVKQ